MKVATFTGRASELSSATSKEKCTVRKGFVKTEKKTASDGAMRFGRLAGGA